MKNHFGKNLHFQQAAHQTYIFNQGLLLYFQQGDSAPTGKFKLETSNI
jgi:hypothetical protein